MPGTELSSVDSEAAQIDKMFALVNVIGPPF